MPPPPGQQPEVQPQRPKAGGRYLQGSPVLLREEFQASHRRCRCHRVFLRPTINGRRRRTIQSHIQIQRHGEALGGTGRHREAPGGTGRYWEALGGTGKHWEAPRGTGRKRTKPPLTASWEKNERSLHYSQLGGK